MHISSSYAKILGETNFHTREFPRSRSKAKDGEKEKEERPKLVITMDSYALQRHLGWRTQSRLGKNSIQTKFANAVSHPQEATNKKTVTAQV